MIDGHIGVLVPQVMEPDMWQTSLDPESVPGVMHMFQTLTQRVMFEIIHVQELIYSAVEGNTLTMSGTQYR